MVVGGVVGFGYWGGWSDGSVGFFAQSVDLVGVGGLEGIDICVALLTGLAVELVTVLFEDVARRLRRRQEPHVVHLRPAPLVGCAQGPGLAAQEVPQHRSSRGSHCVCWEVMLLSVGGGAESETNLEVGKISNGGSGRTQP